MFGFLLNFVGRVLPVRAPSELAMLLKIRHLFNLLALKAYILVHRLLVIQYFFVPWI
jgi:hypothetical protein